MPSIYIDGQNIRFVSKIYQTGIIIPEYSITLTLRNHTYVQHNISPLMVNPLSLTNAL